MLTLGIDTATKVCTIALIDKEKILAAYEINMGMTHSEGLVPQMDQLFQRTGIAKKELELIAVSRGPGSFTGLRIGLATAEAMAYGLQIPMIAVSTLEVLAYNLPVDNILLAPVLDAQKGNYYVALYEWHKGELQEVAPVTIMPGKELYGFLEQYNKETVLLGECDKLIIPENENISLAPLWNRLPRGSAVALLGEKLHKVGGDMDYFGTEPFYIRKSEAEELWDKKQQKK